jgi:hypothetical protein
MAAAPNVQFSLLNLKDSNFGGTNSYVINPASVAKVANLLDGELVTGPSTSIDMVYRREVQRGRLKAGVIFPFLTRIHLDLATQTTIGAREFDPAYSLASDLLRLCFYVDLDPAEVRRALAPLKAPSANDRQLDFIADIVRVMISR